MSKIFISHDSRDHAVAKLLAELLERLTLNQLKPWYSSDDSAEGGIKPGGIWADVLRNQLLESKAVVPLLTPRSLEKPWVMFESGFGAANSKCDVIPVCVGMPQDEIPFPLAMYQTFQLTDYNSLKKFISKLLKKFNVPFDEVMARPILEGALTHMHKIDVEPSDNEVIPLSANEAIENVKGHIDRRLLSLIRSQSALLGQYEESGESLYSVQVSINLPSLKKDLNIEVLSGTTMADVLNNIYLSLDGVVKPYSYLKSWVLEETEKGIRIFIREGASRIPATTLIAPNTKWQVTLLDEPLWNG